MESEIVSISWPSRSLQVLNYIVFVVAISSTVAILSRRLPVFKVLTKFDLSSSKWICDVSLLLTFVSSTVFSFVSGIFLYLNGMITTKTCLGAILFCLSAYVATKSFFYFYLLERCYVVHRTDSLVLRRNCWPWIVGCGLYILVIPTAVCFGLAREHKFVERHGAPFCHVGLRHAYALPLICWDICLNCYLCLAFTLPLWRGRLQSCKARSLAKRALILTIVSTASTLGNFVTLLALRGELGTVCLMSCNLDIVIVVVSLACTTPEQAESQVAISTPSIEALNIAVLPSQAFRRKKEEDLEEF